MTISPMRALLRSAAVLGVFAIATGCGSGDPLGDVDSVRDWANRSSAVGVWSRVNDLVAAGAGRDPFRDPECPVVVTTGDTTTVTGDCTANDGRSWVGMATIVRGEGQDQDLEIAGFGNAEDVGLVTRLSGTVMIRGMTDGRHAFELDLESDAVFGGITTIAYGGVVEGDFTGPTTWNGSGTFTLEGDEVSAATEDEVWDGLVCNGAPASGRTTMTSALHTVVVVYDGAVDCDEEKAVAWSRDGVDQGTIDGITCAASAGGGRAALPLLLTGLVLAAAWRRRGREIKSL